MQTLSIDIETYSPQDLSKVGVYKYAENCEVMLVAYAYNDEPVRIVDLAQGEELPFKLVESLSNPQVVKTAFNAAFELSILEKYLGKQLDSFQWQCTMVQAMSLGLPSSLEQVGKVLNLASDKRKLTTGKKLIEFFSQPSKSKSNKTQQPTLWGDEPNRNMPKDHLEKWEEFKEYCKQDVEAERAIRKRIAKYAGTTNLERHLWKLDRTINGNGVWIDMDLVEKAIRIDEIIKTALYRKGEILTGGLNLNSNVQMLKWIEAQEGHPVAGLDKEARAALLKNPKTTPQVRSCLEIKEKVCKISTKKYSAMKETACRDHRARGMFKFYGANRTGRWSGWGIQLQNLPQNHIKELDIARRFVKQGNAKAMQIFFENPIDVLSQLIRTAFVAEKGSRFLVADFSAIEARVLAWLADEKWRMEVFANGGDIYCASASAMFGVPVEKHGVNAELRQKGKVAELACGYGGGVGALKAMGADKMGLSDADMQAIITKWRKANPKISNFWSIMEKCAKFAIRNRTKKKCRKGIAFECVGEYLFVHLPSGRKISYFHPQIVKDINGKEKLTYEGTSQTNSGWSVHSTWGGKLVENIVQAIARDCLATAMLNLNHFGYKIVMHVHDEVIIEMPQGVGTLDRVLQLMRHPLKWAEGLVLNAEGYETEYYRKD